MPQTRVIEIEIDKTEAYSSEDIKVTKFNVDGVPVDGTSYGDCNIGIYSLDVPTDDIARGPVQPTFGVFQNPTADPFSDTMSLNYPYGDKHPLPPGNYTLVVDGEPNWNAGDGYSLDMVRADEGYRTDIPFTIKEPPQAGAGIVETHKIIQLSPAKAIVDDSAILSGADIDVEQYDGDATVMFNFSGLGGIGNPMFTAWIEGSKDGVNYNESLINFGRFALGGDPITVVKGIEISAYKKIRLCVQLRYTDTFSGFYSCDMIINSPVDSATLNQ